MGGSSGSGSRYTRVDVESLREEARARLGLNQRDAEINRLIAEELVAINDRDADQINDYLEDIESAISEHTAEFDRILFGGSVAKHTFVDGMSDVDALVVLDGDEHGEVTPGAVLGQLQEILKRYVPSANIESITTGALAVTIRYEDGNEIQLLPAIRTDGGLSISSGLQSWIDIDPQRFARALTDANRRNGSAVIPAIKIAKVILDSQLGNNSPSGYHTESLAIAAFNNYEGPRTPKAMVERLLDTAVGNVLTPTPDITGQSSHVDQALGVSNSPARQQLSREIRDVANLVKNGSVKDWESMLS